MPIWNSLKTEIIPAFIFVCVSLSYEQKKSKKLYHNASQIVGTQKKFADT